MSSQELNTIQFIDKEELINWLKDTLTWPEKVKLFKEILQESVVALDEDELTDLLQAMGLEGVAIDVSNLQHRVNNLENFARNIVNGIRNSTIY